MWMESERTQPQPGVRRGDQGAGTEIDGQQHDPGAECGHQ
jgi:hypothetical protein